MTNAIFIAATAQHVGKTTTCLGIVSGLKKRFDSVGFCKPVGQRHTEVAPDLHVDKDVVLFRERFDLTSDYQDMSPVILPSGFTRDYLDGRVDHDHLRQSILDSYARVHQASNYTVVEGTGHAGVGSIIGLSNADVAAALGLDVVLITTGGVGAAFDQLALNLTLFRAAGVNVRAIIINKVIPDKMAMVKEYIPKAVKQWGIPVVGYIPYSELLNAPTMRDYEQLFGVPLLSGKGHHYRHFFHERLVVTTAHQSLHSACPSELIITHASREDIIRATLEDELQSRRDGGDLQRGIILTGHTPPSNAILDEVREAQVPMLYAPLSSYNAMRKIAGFTAKIRREDVDKVEKAIDLVEEQIDFEALL